MSTSDSVGARVKNKKRSNTALSDPVVPSSGKMPALSVPSKPFVFAPPTSWDPKAFSFGSDTTDLLSPPVQKPLKGAVKSRKMLQPKLHMRPLPKPKPYSPPKGFDDLATDWGKSAKRVKTESESLKGFGKFTGTSDAVKKRAKSTGFDLEGGNQGGLKPPSPFSGSFLPDYMDYSRARPSQMLSQLSEVMLYSAQEDKIDPTEIQFGYGVTDKGHMDVFASANKPKTQEWLQKAMANPHEHIIRAANSKDPEMQKIGAKLIGHDEQQEQRWESVKSQPDAQKIHQDMQLAGSIRESFLKGAVTVVKNTGNRHAEQNIALAMHNKGGYQFGDIEGTKIRCMSCSSSLNPNLVDTKGVGVLGKAYTSQSSESQFGNTFKSIKSGDAHVHSGLPNRPRSNSLPAIKVPDSILKKSDKK